MSDLIVAELVRRLVAAERRIERLEAKETPPNLVRLNPPATSTSWDADAKDVDNNGIIDLSTVFSLPAGIKGVFAKLSAKNTSAAGKYSSLGADSTNAYALVVTPLSTADIYISNGPALVPCDANGDIYFKTDAAHGAENTVAIQIYGYLI